jgi:ADP-ribosyl-[dinitrogen reductase] hydrolase
VVFRFAGENITLFANRVQCVSAITHGHARSRMACVFHGLVVRKLLLGSSPQTALDFARAEFRSLYNQAAAIPHFRHILEDDLVSLSEGAIVSTGYVLHTLHASLWCLLTTQNFQDCVLKAVNFGGDTDTTGCVAGGLAGVAYGMKSIPPDWVGQLARKGEIECLYHKFTDVCQEAVMKSVR